MGTTRFLAVLPPTRCPVVMFQRAFDHPADRRVRRTADDSRGPLPYGSTGPGLILDSPGVAVTVRHDCLRRPGFSGPTGRRVGRSGNLSDPTTRVLRRERRRPDPPF